jgi:tRNA nucleotidyltransferase (CCA-adding enzyme)
MQIYLVGGAVRDALLGVPGADRDWVVVGATPEQMLALGYQPVGKDFPVFLHPQTGEEYALARTERKTAPGYKGFVVHASPEVTLEQDLARRDLTLNAMAQDAQGQLIDPFGGKRDLQAGILRHVTEAFREDPVRILRLARFAARFETFVVAPETMALCRHMVDAGEVDALVPERVWQEVERGLQTPCPARMAQVLMDCGAWQRLWPELNADDPQHTHALQRLDAHFDPSGGLNLGQRWALWCHGATPEQVTGIGERFRVPAAVQDMAWAWATHRHVLAQPARDTTTVCEQLYLMDPVRRPGRVRSLIELAMHISQDDEQIQIAQSWLSALNALLAVDAKAVNRQALAQGLRGEDVGLALKQAHTEAIGLMQKLGSKLGSDPN